MLPTVVCATKTPRSELVQRWGRLKRAACQKSSACKQEFFFLWRFSTTQKDCSRLVQKESFCVRSILEICGWNLFFFDTLIDSQLVKIQTHPESLTKNPWKWELKAGISFPVDHVKLQVSVSQRTKQSQKTPLEHWKSSWLFRVYSGFYYPVTGEYFITITKIPLQLESNGSNSWLAAKVLFESWRIETLPTGALQSRPGMFAVGMQVVVVVQFWGLQNI